VTRRRLLVLVAVVGGLWFLAPGAPARAETTNAAVTEDAWYAPLPTCLLPIGCGPTESVPATSRYPAGTRHVGLTAGVEDARSYLKLDLLGVPPLATFTGGTLTIPIGPTEDGSATPEAAQVVACLATAPFAASEGSPAPPPPVDCATSAPAQYQPGPPAVLVVDLTPFAARWASGTENNGIALLPATGAAPGTTWHVAFSSRDRAGSSVAAPRAELNYEPVPAPVPEPEPLIEESVDLGVFGELAPALTPPPASPAAAIVQQSEGPSRVLPVVEFGGPGFAYPVVMAMPLILLALGGYLGWALTQPVAPTDR
jgi:hypothetical protein